MLGGMFSSCACAMYFRTVSEYWKRSPQMRQCHWSPAKMYGPHSGLFGSSLRLGIRSVLIKRHCLKEPHPTWSINIMHILPRSPWRSAALGAAALAVMAAAAAPAQADPQLSIGL